MDLDDFKYLAGLVLGAGGLKMANLFSKHRTKARELDQQNQKSHLEEKKRTQSLDNAMRIDLIQRIDREARERVQIEEKYQSEVDRRISAESDGRRANDECDRLRNIIIDLEEKISRLQKLVDASDTVRHSTREEDAAIVQRVLDRYLVERVDKESTATMGLRQFLDLNEKMKEKK